VQNIRNRHGFLILSLCIYLICFTLFVFLCSNFMWPSIKKIYTCHQKAKLISDLHLVSDIVLRDLWHAPSDLTQWYTHNTSTLIWKDHAKGAIGWFAQPHGIQRIQGIYDPLSSSWHSAAYTTVSRSITIHFASEYHHNRICYVQADLQNDTEQTTVAWSFHANVS
jgi:hypothetical protein